VVAFWFVVDGVDFVDGSIVESNFSSCDFCGCSSTLSASKSRLAHEVGIRR